MWLGGVGDVILDHFEDSETLEAMVIAVMFVFQAKRMNARLSQR